MSCKNKVWSECGNISSRKWDNICYYKCSDNCCESPKCKKEICKAKEILDRIKNKNDHLGDYLNDAKENQEDVKDALSKIEDNVCKLANDLEKIQKALGDSIKSLCNIVKNLEKAQISQDKSLCDVNNAIKEQECIDELLYKLECGIHNIIECFGENCSHPILVPWEEDCCKHSGKICRPNKCYENRNYDC